MRLAVTLCIVPAPPGIRSIFAGSDLPAALYDRSGLDQKDVILTFAGDLRTVCAHVNLVLIAAAVLVLIAAGGVSWWRLRVVLAKIRDQQHQHER